MDENNKDMFSIYAEARDYDKPLIQTNLSFARLIDEIVVPSENEDPFFIDGVPVTKKSSVN